MGGRVNTIIKFLRVAIILYGSIFFFYCCHREVISLDLENTADKIVIEANVSDQRGPQTVRINKICDYDKADEFPPVSGAIVRITDDAGSYEILQENTAGIYQTSNLRGMPTRTYTLEVSLGNKKYVAYSTMPQPIYLDSIVFANRDYQSDLVCYFTDRAGMEDYYRFKFYINGELATTYLYQGRFKDGQSIAIDNLDITVNRNDRVMIQVFAVEKVIYEYFAMLGENDGADYDPEFPDFFIVTMYNPKSNINNDALGYFSANSIRTFNLIAP